MKTAALLVFAIATLAFAKPAENKNVKTQLKEEDWRAELMEGDCTDLFNYDLLLTKTVKGPANGGIQFDEVQYSGEKVVKCIIVKKLVTDNTEDSVALIGGGVGQHSAELKFLSQNNKAMAFQVDVYGTN